MAKTITSLNKNNSLCSGYRVFPNGSKCKGCIDCNFLKDKSSIAKVFNRTHVLLKVTKRKK